MNQTRKMTQTAMIAGLYAAITFAMFFISFGAVQFRISEALTVLPAFTALSIPGLSLGCALANLIGALIGVNPVGYVDALFGTAATLLAAVLTYCIGKSKRKMVRYFFCPLPPILINAVVIGFEISAVFEGTVEPAVLFLNMGSVLLGQAAVCYLLGIPLMMALERKDTYKKIFR